MFRQPRRACCRGHEPLGNTTVVTAYFVFCLWGPALFHRCCRARAACRRGSTGALSCAACGCWSTRCKRWASTRCFLFLSSPSARMSIANVMNETERYTPLDMSQTSSYYTSTMIRPLQQARPARGRSYGAGLMYRSTLVLQWYGELVDPDNDTRKYYGVGGQQRCRYPARKVNIALPVSTKDRFYLVIRLAARPWQTLAMAAVRSRRRGQGAAKWC